MLASIVYGARSIQHWNGFLHRGQSAGLSGLRNHVIIQSHQAYRPFFNGRGYRASTLIDSHLLSCTLLIAAIEQRLAHYGIL